MKIENNPHSDTPTQLRNLHKVTPLSKYLALVLFVALPFIGGWVGYQYAPEMIVEIEKTGEVAAEDTSMNCKVDTDCVLVQPDCEDCTFDSINKREVSTFQSQKRNRCELNPPTMMCGTVFAGEIKCINNKCQLTD